VVCCKGFVVFCFLKCFVTDLLWFCGFAVVCDGFIVFCEGFWCLVMALWWFVMFLCGLLGCCCVL